jgi:hypothetical protein
VLRPNASRNACRPPRSRCQHVSLPDHGTLIPGTKPGDLPFERATKFETIVNLKTAKALGVDLPTSILLRADEVIE